MRNNKIVTVYKTLYFRCSLLMAQISESVFILGRNIQPSLTFASKAEYFRCSNLGLVPSLTDKSWTLLERPARDKHTSLLGPFVSSKENKVL